MSAGCFGRVLQDRTGFWLGRWSFDFRTALLSEVSHDGNAAQWCEEGMVSQRISSGKEAASTKPVIVVVDDDDSMRQALARLFYSVNLPVQTFAC
jgi:hypothetical protein